MEEVALSERGREVLERMRKLEEKGRLIASKPPEEPVSRKEIGTIESFAYLSLDIVALLNELDFVISEKERQLLDEFLTHLSSAYTYLEWIADACVALPREKCNATHPELSENFALVKDRLRETDRTYRKLTGKERCTWLLGVKEPYTFNATVNDATACLHRLIELVEEKLKGWKVEGKCMWRE